MSLLSAWSISLDSTFKPAMNGTRTMFFQQYLAITMYGVWSSQTDYNLCRLNTTKLLNRVLRNPIRIFFYPNLPVRIYFKCNFPPQMPVQNTEVRILPCGGVMHPSPVFVFRTINGTVRHPTRKSETWYRYCTTFTYLQPRFRKKKITLTYDQQERRSDCAANWFWTPKTGTVTVPYNVQCNIRYPIANNLSYGLHTYLVRSSCNSSTCLARSTASWQ